MKRESERADDRLWALVAATVRPLPGRSVPRLEEAEPQQAPRPVRSPATTPTEPIVRHRQSRPPQAIEPKRRRRVELEREVLAGRLDLHGLDQDRARLALTNYILRCYADGLRVVLVITGKGALGAGILRRRAPEWLATPPLRDIVAGISEAHRRHGGEGALYVAVKRNPDQRRQPL